MKYLSVKEFSEAKSIPERTARHYCANGKIQGAFQTGRTWNIPVDATLAEKEIAHKPKNALLDVLKEQKEMNLKGGIYHRT